jgi:hypothetical protein
LPSLENSLLNPILKKFSINNPGQDKAGMSAVKLVVTRCNRLAR